MTSDSKNSSQLNADIESLKETFFLDEANVNAYYDLLHFLDKVAEDVKPNLGSAIMAHLNRFFELERKSGFTYMDRMPNIANQKVKDMKKNQSFQPKREEEREVLQAISNSNWAIDEKLFFLENMPPKIETSTLMLALTNADSESQLINIENNSPKRKIETVSAMPDIKLLALPAPAASILVDFEDNIEKNMKNYESLLDLPVFDNTPVLVPTRCERCELVLSTSPQLRFC